MDLKNTRTLVKYAALVIVLAIVLMEEPTSIPVCNINANTLENCRPAVTGNNPPPPSDECCMVLQVTNLECICRFKSYLPVLATNSYKVQALLRKCGITRIPPCLPSFEKLRWRQTAPPQTLLDLILRLI